MQTPSVEVLSRLLDQLKSFHSELSAMTKKSPHDLVNKFKLKFINVTLKACNGVLSKQDKPFQDFSQFNTDELPSNSDVTMILSQYIMSVDRLRDTLQDKEDEEEY